MASDEAMKIPGLGPQSDGLEPGEIDEHMQAEAAPPSADTPMIDALTIETIATQVQGLIAGQQARDQLFKFVVSNLPQNAAVKEERAESGVQVEDEVSKFLDNLSSEIGSGIDGINGPNKSNATTVNGTLKLETTVPNRTPITSQPVKPHAKQAEGTENGDAIAGAEVEVDAIGGQNNMAVVMPMIKSLVKENKRIVKDMGAMKDRIDKLEKEAARAVEREKTKNESIERLRSKLLIVIDVVDDVLRGEAHNRVKTKMQVRSINAQLQDMWETLERLEYATFPANRVLPTVKGKLRTAGDSANYWSSLAYNAALAGPRPEQLMHVRNAIHEINQYQRVDHVPGLNQRHAISKADANIMKDAFTQVQDLHTNLQKLNPNKYDRRGPAMGDFEYPRRGDDRHGSVFKPYANMKEFKKPYSDLDRDYGRNRTPENRKRERSRSRSPDPDVLTSRNMTPFKILTYRPSSPSNKEHLRGDQYRARYGPIPTGPKGPALPAKPDWYPERKVKRRDTRPRKDWDRPRDDSI